MIIKLSNEAVLNGDKMQEADTGGFTITKEIARKVFAGKTEEVTATCGTCENAHTETFEVRSGKGFVHIGCKEFTGDDLKLVKKWLKR